MKIRQQYVPLLYGLLTLVPFLTVTGQNESRQPAGISVATQPDISSLRHYNPWEQSLNPAGIQLTPIDSLLEAQILYSNRQPTLTATDQPGKTVRYNGTAEGYQRLGRLQLSGGLGWQQDRLEGQSWNYLVQPDCLVTAGDSLGNPRHAEQYSIYGKASYVFSSHLLAGLSGSYMATNNKDASPEKRYTGHAHTASLSAGLIRSGQSGRIGLSAVYTHRTELLSSASDNGKRLYTFPLGYFTPMTEFSFNTGGTSGSSTSKTGQYRSIANGGQVALQAEWQRSGWNWFNELSGGYTCRSISPDYTSYLYGWKEQAFTLGYHSRFSLPRGRWTHLLSPTLSLQRIVSDRILQLSSPDNTDGGDAPTNLLRFASRHTANASAGYELARDYTPDGPSLAWQLTASWAGRRDELYSHPYTIAQLTGTVHAEAAFVRRFTLPHASRLMFRPSLGLLTGYGTEERITREDNKAETEMNTYRNYERVSSTFASLTATRLRLGLQAEYRRPLAGKVDGGFRLGAEIEQVVRNKTDYRTDRMGGGFTLAFLVWL